MGVCTNLPPILSRQGAAAATWRGLLLLVAGSYQPQCGDNTAGLIHYDDVLLATPNGWNGLAHLGTENQRTHHGVAVVRDVLYVLGGYGGTGDPPVGNALDSVISVDLADLSHPVKSLAPLPGGATTNLGVVADPSGDTLYVVGGYSYPPNQPHAAATNTVWAYTIATDTWHQLPSMPTARGALGVAVVTVNAHPNNNNNHTNNHTVLIAAVGGFSRSVTNPKIYTPLDVVEVYNVATKTWHTGPSLPHPRSTLNMVVGTVQGSDHLVVVGGNNVTEDLCFVGMSIIQRPVVALPTTALLDHGTRSMHASTTMQRPPKHVSTTMQRHPRQTTNNSTRHASTPQNVKPNVSNYPSPHASLQSMNDTDDDETHRHVRRRGDNGNDEDNNTTINVHAGPGWVTLSSWPSPRGYTAATVVGDSNDVLVIAGGYNGTVDSDSVTRFNLTSKVWQECE
eukprot:m.201581 g.201581  ORF g.201581 m.201581 type:complete len:452 (+) comp21471_c0_seq1:219-1574(+)